MGLYILKATSVEELWMNYLGSLREMHHSQQPTSSQRATRTTRAMPVLAATNIASCHQDNASKFNTQVPQLTGNMQGKDIIQLGFNLLKTSPTSQGCFGTPTQSSHSNSCNLIHTQLENSSSIQSNTRACPQNHP